MTEKWITHGVDTKYGSRWVSVHVADIETPSGLRHPHHLVRVPQHGAGTLVLNEGGDVLLVFRYRFIPDSFGWEIPAGRVDEGEAPDEAARREVLEETGWSLKSLRYLALFDTSPGLTDQKSHLFIGRAGEFVHAPTDVDEAIRTVWHSPADVRSLLGRGEIKDGFTACALLWNLAMIEPGN